MRACTTVGDYLFNKTVGATESSSRTCVHRTDELVAEKELVIVVLRIQIN